MAAKKTIINLPEDRISMLPDDLRTKILTCLPTEDAIKTAILSSKWNGLWTPQGEVEFDFNSMTEDIERLQELIETDLSQSQKPPLLKFVLRCNLFNSEMRYSIGRLLCAVAHRHVMELEVSVGPDKDKARYSLPVIVLKCQQLKYLKLSGVRVPHGTGPIFPYLKILHVDISQKCDISLQDLYSKLPALEELTLEGSITQPPMETDIRRFELFSRTLKTLQIKIETDYEEWEEGPLYPKPTYSFHINAPKLEYLFINENLLAPYTVLDCSGIVKATVQCGKRCVNSYWDARSICDIFCLIRGLQNVHSLALHDQTTTAAGFILRGLYKRKIALPFFSQLKELTLQVSNRWGCGFVMYLLNQAPELKFLAIEMVERNADELDADSRTLAWTRPAVTPVCFRARSLNNVQLKGLLGHEEMIDFFCDIMEFLNN